MLTPSTKLPIDVFGTSEHEKSRGDAQSSSEPSDVLGAWKKYREEVNSSPNDISKWKHLFSKIKTRLAEVNEKQLNYEFKYFIKKSYSDLLLRFPYLVAYWKEFSTLEYRLNGLDASILILKKAVSACAYSIDLWLDYLSALIVQYDEDRSTDLKEDIMKQFESCLSLNKYNFNSYHIYDKFFEFKQKVMRDYDKEEAYFDEILELIAIPTYEYSKYYSIFTEIYPNFNMKEKIDKKVIGEYEEQFGKKFEELTEVELGQVYHDYGYKIFMKTQSRVSEKWEHEVLLTRHELDLEPALIEKELDHWLRYLDYEIAHYESDSSSFPVVINLFERCLIPNCLNTKVWLKYIAFLNFSQLGEDEKFSQTDAVFKRASEKFVPLDDNFIRLVYGEFLLKFDKTDTLNSHYLDLIKYFSGKNNSHLYFKTYYIDTIDNLLKLWARASDTDTLEKGLNQIIENYFTNIDSYRPSDITFDDKLLSKESFNTLQNLLNDQSILVVIETYLKLATKDFNSDDDQKVKQLRQFFNKFYKEEALRSSQFFWTFFVRLEGLGLFDYQNLKFITNYIKNNLLLPKKEIDNIINVNYKITSANYKEILTIIPNDNTLLTYDNDRSTSLLHNNSYLKRVSNNNSKVSDRNGSGKSYNPKSASYLNMVRSHFENPGITVDARPDITNKLMISDINLLDDEVPIPKLPTFKNVEKASQNIKYPS